MGATNFAGSLDLTATESDLESFRARPAPPLAEVHELRVGRLAIVRAAGAAGALAHDEDVLALCMGAVEWRDSEFAQIARQRGNAFALISAYRRHGLDCLRYLQGAFAATVLDPAQRIALAAIDRIGIQSLHFAAQTERFVFGCTPQEVAAHRGVGRQIDPQAIYNYLYAHVVPAPGSIYKGVKKLLPAQYVLWRNGRSECGFYWHLAYHARAAKPLARLEERFRALLRESVRDATVGVGKVGAFLSGGTDSSTVTGVLRELRGEPVNAYSIGFEADGFDEMAYAKIAARHFGVTHHPYYVTPADVAEAVPLITAAYPEPFGNASAVPTYFCAKRAAEDGVDLMLAGDGGDEIFGGNARYAKQRVFEAYKLLPAWIRASIVEPALLNGAALGGMPLLRKAASYVQQATIPLPDRLEAYNFLMRESLDALFEPEFVAAIDPTQPARSAREVYERAASSSHIDRMMHLDLKVTLADNDLRKVSRMCEVAGVRVRYPLLSDAMVEFSGEVPAGLKVKGLQLRYLFKHALHDFLPVEVIEKKKHGFGLPFGVWLQTDRTLRDMAHESLSSFGRRGFLRPAYLEALTYRHGRENASYYGVMIWVIMMLEQWLAQRGE